VRRLLGSGKGFGFAQGCLSNTKVRGLLESSKSGPGQNLSPALAGLQQPAHSGAGPAAHGVGIGGP